MADQDKILDILHPSTYLEWEEWPSLPVKMSNAASVYLNGTLYFGGGITDEPGWRAEASLYSFKPGVDRTWTVTDTPTYRYTLVTHNSELLLVGGCEYPTIETTNKVFTMRGGQFVEALPPMKETQRSPSAVSSGSALVVVGGTNTSGDLSSVEVFKDGQWTTAPSLPNANAGQDIKSVLHGDQWYLITSVGKVFRTSLQSLISGSDQSPWETLPDAPNCYSTAAFFGGRLLSIGGDRGRAYDDLTTAIYAFSSSTQSWEHVADLPLPLTHSSAVVLPTGELLVIGGTDKREKPSNKVFRAFLKVPLIVQFNIPKLHQLHKYGINLMELLSKDRYRFHITSGVHLLVKDRKKAPTLSPSDYVELIFNAWKRSKRPSYPPTWEGLFTVLRKMDLGHLTEQIAKCVTGSLPEIEDSPLPSESEVQLSPGDKEQATAGGESSVTELRSEVKRRLLEYESLQAELDQLTDEYDEQADKIHQLEKEIEYLRNEIHFLRAESKGLVPVKQELKVEPGYQDVISCPHLPTEVLSQPQESIHSFDLPGVEVVASTCVIVTNSLQTIHWVGYGFKLTIPQGSLPAGVDQCQLEIKASVAGQYQFPDNLQLVSGVFWIRPLPLCRFQQQLTVEIQHCAKMTSSTKLSFVRAHCSQESMPYTFKQLEGRGSFTEHSSYGCLSVNHFSSYAIAAEGDVDLLYVASLYYLKADPRTVEIHFTINVDDAVHNAATQYYFQKLGAENKLTLEVEFEDSNISLDIPITSGVDIDEWRLKPLVKPKISKKRVNSFKPGRIVPSTKLEATLSESSWGCKVPKRSHLTTLKGTKEPDNQIWIVLDPVDPNQVAPPPQVLNPMSAVAIPGQQSGSHYAVLAPSLPSLHEFPPSLLSVEQSHTSLTLSSATPPPPPHWNTRLQQWSHTGEDDERDEDQLCIEGLQDIFSLLIKAAKDWFELGLALGIKVNTLEGIKSKENCDKARLREMLTHWLRSSSSRTWSDICNGLRSDTVQQDVLADIVEEKYKGATPWEHSSRPRPLTGEKREATEHTEQGSSPQETSVRGAVREENGLRTLSSLSVDGYLLKKTGEQY
ncbi:uncharacterized protein LOC135347813 isoform X3 [Halichondria panicea]|uniref:uncharacterized protein LOC135347813 isoform X3 n=1 Tax=Halichondria panicea TaxID=6063 RepID=UPI00312BA018